MPGKKLVHTLKVDWRGFAESEINLVAALIVRVAVSGQQDQKRP